MLDDFSFIFEEKISDHKPIIAQNILSWNILCLAKPGNNGFHMDETPHYATAYFVRLKKIIQVIEWLVKIHPGIKIICLQEAPYLPEYQAIFIEYFAASPVLKKFDVLDRIQSRTGSHEFQLMTFYDRYYRGKDVTHDLKVGNNNQQGRYHLIELTTLSNGATFRIGNVHLKWFPKKRILRQKATNRVIRYLVTKHGCSLAGDFNKSMRWVSEDRVIKRHYRAFFYPKANSYSRSETGKVYYGQFDAVILV